MRAFRTGDSQHPGRSGASPYDDLLAQGPPSGRPAGNVRAADVEARPRPEVRVVLPGELPPRAAPQRPEPTARPADTPGGANPGGHRGTPPRPRRFRPYYRLGLVLLFGLTIGGFFLVGVAVDRLGEWDHEVTVQTDTELSFPRSQERWIWLPEQHLGDLACTGTDGAGADLPMRPALGYDHDDYSSAFRFPTGDGDVTLRCDTAPSPATPGWTASGSETVRVAKPVDLAEDVPFLQVSLVITLGSAALGALLLTGTLLTQIITAVAGAVRARRRRAGRRTGE